MTKEKFTYKWWHSSIDIAKQYEGVWFLANRSDQGRVDENKGVFEIDVRGPMDQFTEEHRSKLTVIFTKLRLFGCEIRGWP